MKYPLALILLASTTGASIAQDVKFEILHNMYPLDMSTDGSVIVGNDFNFETVRWTADTGVVNLGRGTQSLGVGAGTPDCSDDGTVVSATIINAAGTLGTQGRWTEENGWEDLLSPPPVDGGVIDLSYGSAWGMSGNGEHVLGFYWRPGNGGPSGDGLAHASISGLGPVVVDLGSTINNSRANHANFDGSVVVGWDTSASFGYWSPTVWENGTLTHLNTNQGWAMANHVTSDGNIIGGYAYNELFEIGEATLWHRDGGSWTEAIIGSLPGTVGPHGSASVNSMTPDGTTVVGFNKFNNSAAAAGFIWNETDGMINIIDWLTARGVVIPENMLIVDLTCISSDGGVMAGIGIDTNTAIPLGFRISPLCRADFTDDGALDIFDVFEFIEAYNNNEVSADFTGDGIFDIFDVFEFLEQFNAGC